MAEPRRGVLNYSLNYAASVELSPAVCVCVCGVDIDRLARAAVDEYLDWHHSHLREFDIQSFIFLLAIYSCAHTGRQ